MSIIFVFQFFHNLSSEHLHDNLIVNRGPTRATNQSIGLTAKLLSKL